MIRSLGLSPRFFLLFLSVLALAGASPPFPQALATSPITAAATSVPARITPNPDNDEDPSVVLAHDGRFHVAWSAKQGGQVDLFIRSSRNGRTWLDERRVTNDSAEDYYPSLAQSRDGMFHLAWFQLQRKEGRVDIWYTRSPDGRRWEHPTPITHQGQDWAPAIYEASRGVLWIVWTSWRTGNREIFASRSTDGGHRWSAPQQVTRSPEEDDFPHALKTIGGERVLVWTRYASGSPLADYFRDATAEIVMATSRDGLRWSAPASVSPADPDARYMDFLPFAFMDSDRRRLFVSWTSNRSHIDRGDILVRDLFSPSSPVQQLTTGAYDAKIVPTRQRGEYLMVWVSTTNGKPDLFAGRFRL